MTVSEQQYRQCLITNERPDRPTNGRASNIAPKYSVWLYDKLCKAKQHTEIEIDSMVKGKKVPFQNDNILVA